MKIVSKKCNISNRRKKNTKNIENIYKNIKNINKLIIASH